MQIPDEIRLVIEIAAVAGSAGITLMKLGRLGERFDNHAEQLKVQGQAIDKIEDTLQTVATQKEQIQSIRDTVTTNTRRIDETFNRVFTILDRLQERGASGP